MVNRKTCYLVIFTFVSLLLLLGCEDQPRVQRGAPSEVSSISPATPGLPEEPGESRAKPSTPRPAPTPAPAKTPTFAVTPLAVLSAYTPVPTMTAVPRPTATPVNSEQAEIRRKENIERCKHWALQLLQPVVYSRFEKLDPYDMTDLERVLWGGVLLGQNQFQSIPYPFEPFGEEWGNHKEWCQDYWSEALSAENAHKRNHEVFRVQCIARLAPRAIQFADNAERACDGGWCESVSPVVISQAARLMNWMDMEWRALMALDKKPHELVAEAWDYD